MDNLIQNIEVEKRNEAIGLLINSLQRPSKELIQSICEKQKKMLKNFTNH